MGRTGCHRCGGGGGGTKSCGKDGEPWHRAGEKIAVEGTDGSHRAALICLLLPPTAEATNGTPA